MILSSIVTISPSLKVIRFIPRVAAISLISAIGVYQLWRESSYAVVPIN